MGIFSLNPVFLSEGAPNYCFGFPKLVAALSQWKELKSDKRHEYSRLELRGTSRSRLSSGAPLVHIFVLNPTIWKSDYFVTDRAEE